MILHEPTKFHLNQTIPAELLHPINVSRWQPWHHKSASGSGYGDVTRLKSKSICNQILTRYLNPQLIYFNFQFLKTKSRHTRILFSSLCHYRQSLCLLHFSYHMKSKSSYLQRSYDVTVWFSLTKTKMTKKQENNEFVNEN